MNFYKRFAIFVVLQIIISVPLYVLAFLLLGNLVADNKVFEYVTTTALYAVATYFTLLVLRKKFTSQEATKLAYYVSGLTLVLGLLSLITGGGIISELLYVLVGFFEIRWFLSRE